MTFGHKRTFNPTSQSGGLRDWTFLWQAWRTCVACVENAGLPGWVIRANYPDGGDDILLVNTSVLDYVDTEAC